MINVIKEQQGNILVVRIVGSVEENVNFEQVVGPCPPANSEMHVNCKGVTRINSVGVKSWIRYFQNIKAKGVNLKFVECSTTIVEQLNFISNFNCGGEIISIYVPFSCDKCHTELVGLFKADVLKKLKYKVPPLKCSKCGGQAVFDDVPEEYFAFMMAT